MTGTIISLASRRADQPADGRVRLEQQEALDRLRFRISQGDIVYTVLRDDGTAGFYLIDGHHIGCLTADLARALDRPPPRMGSGMRVSQAQRREALCELIDGTLSHLLFGEADAITHQIIE